MRQPQFGVAIDCNPEANPCSNVKDNSFIVCARIQDHASPRAIQLHDVMKSRRQVTTLIYALGTQD
jgi:hypothetical protein